jgi:membrane protein DedA with SNARE-associated domain
MLDMLARYGLVAAFILLTAAGTGVPIPEEPTQLGAGALAQRGAFPLAAAIAVCWTGILAGDFLWFAIARRLGPRVLELRPIRRLLTPERRVKIEAHLRKRGFLTVVVARHLSGLRLPIFALAATHGVGWRTFMLADALSALASVPLVVTAGYLGARHLGRVEAHVRRLEIGALVVVVAAALAVILFRQLRRGRSQTTAEPQELHE